MGQILDTDLGDVFEILGMYRYILHTCGIYIRYIYRINIGHVGYICWIYIRYLLDTHMGYILDTGGTYIGYRTDSSDVHWTYTAHIQNIY